MKWEQELNSALRELAHSVDDVPANPETERRLLEAFDGKQLRGAGLRAGDSAGAGVSGKHGGLPHEGRRGRLPHQIRWALAAAASLALVSAGWWTARYVGGDGRVDPPVARSATPTPSTRPSVSSSPSSPSTSASGEPSLSGPVVGARPTAQNTVAARRPARQVEPLAPAAPTAADEADDFVALPAAEGLPRFESGMVLRVELPATSLPAFGFPITPDGRRSFVPADVLVGQDGQPRAIRLVSMQTGTRRR